MPEGWQRVQHDNLSLADFMRELKKASSAWVHEEIGEPLFGWQDNYAAFTVSASARDAVKHYSSYRNKLPDKKGGGAFL